MNSGNAKKEPVEEAGTGIFEAGTMSAGDGDHDGGAETLADGPEGSPSPSRQAAPPDPNSTAAFTSADLEAPGQPSAAPSERTLDLPPASVGAGPSAAGNSATIQEPPADPMATWGPGAEPAVDPNSTAAFMPPSQPAAAKYVRPHTSLLPTEYGGPAIPWSAETMANPPSHLHQGEAATEQFGATGVHLPDNRGGVGATMDASSTGAFEATVPMSPAAQRQASKAPAAPSGSLCGRYVLKKFHAKGGMGEIWLAEDPAIGRPVALKRMLGRRPDQVYRFEVEAQVTGQLEHPGIVPIHELGFNEEGLPFYAMKFVQGRTLQKVIEEYHAQKKQNGAEEVEQFRMLQIFLSLCQTVAYAHSRGVLHRDLKPENVMLGPYGETILLDWGIAKVMGQPDGAPGESETSYVQLPESDPDTQTQAGAIMGTPSYMAPEVASGLTDEIDQRSDVYLLGGTLYEILTGKQPRKAKTALEMVKLARSEPPVPALKLCPDLPKALDAICRKAMAHAKTDRYNTAQEMAEDLQRFVAGEPVSAYPEEFMARAWRWVKRHRKVIGRSAAAVVVLSASLFAYDKVREAERRRIASDRVAARLETEIRARRDLAEFRRLADEATFYAATTDPSAESAPYFDPRKAEKIAMSALALASQWGPAVEGLPLKEERDELKRDLYDLALLTANVKNQENAHLLERGGEGARTQQTRRTRTEPRGVIRLVAQTKEQPPARPNGAQATLDLLDQASRLQAPSRGFFRLRSLAFEQLGDKQKAAEDKQRADNAKGNATYLDYFLLGEGYRKRTDYRPVDDVAEPPSFQPDTIWIDKAIEQYRLALKIAPEHYWSHFQLGRCYMRLGRYSESTEALGTCIALRPEVPWGYSARGIALAQQKRYDEALEHFSRAIQLSADPGPARLNRGAVYLQKGDLDAALSDFNFVLQTPKEKQLIQAAYYRGLIYLRQNKIKLALADFDRVADDLPNFQPVFLYRAQVQIALGRILPALEDIDAAAATGKKLDPNGWEIHARRGRQLRVLHASLPLEKRAEKAGKAVANLALGELGRARGAGGRSSRLFDDIGAMLEHTGKLDDAILAYTRGLETSPTDTLLRNKRGWAYDLKGRHDEALADFAAAARSDRQNAEAHSGLGYENALRKKTAAAQREAELALMHGAESYMVLHNVACIYAVLSQQSDQAEADEELAVDLLRRAITVWKKKGSGVSELDLIKGDPTFKPLFKAADFQKLLQQESEKVGFLQR